MFRAATHLFEPKTLYREHRKLGKGRCDAATHTKNAICMYQLRHTKKIMHLSDFFNMHFFVTFLLFFKSDSQASLTFRKKT